MSSPSMRDVIKMMTLLTEAANEIVIQVMRGAANQGGKK